jgi:hypothetical protein
VDTLLDRYSKLCIDTRLAAHVPCPALAEHDAQTFATLQSIRHRLDEARSKQQPTSKGDR